MGIYTDLATQSESIKPEVPRVGLSRSSAHQLLSKAYRHDPAPSAPYAAQSELDRIDQLTGTPTAGTYTLTFQVPKLGITINPVAAYNASAAVIQIAINAALPGGITDGAITVTEENAAGLFDGYCDFQAQFEFADQPVVTSIDTSGVTGIGGPQTVTRTVAGQVDRKATQALFELRAVEGTVQISGDPVTDWTRPVSWGQSRPRYSLIQDLAYQTFIEDGSRDAYEAVLALYPRN